MNEEPAWQREARLKGDEARMVRLEERIAAVHELLLDERKARQNYEATLEKHQQQDETRFASIDSRMQGFQTQISTVAETLARIEKKLDGEGGLINRVKELEEDGLARTAVQRFLDSAWAHLLAGATVGISLAGLLHVLGAF